MVNETIAYNSTAKRKLNFFPAKVAQSGPKIYVLAAVSSSFVTDGNTNSFEWAYTKKFEKRLSLSLKEIDEGKFTSFETIDDFLEHLDNLTDE